jgi:L-ascorbate metabolism protein UlaG (beta-lactamase superfamily)
LEKIFKALKWYGHASFAIESSKIIYIDPWNVPASAPKADIILVTHSHYDHLSLSDINRLKKEGTTIICSEDCLDKLSGDVKAMSPGQELEVEGVKIKAVSAYNLSKAFHPRNNKWLGYIITIEGVSVYHSGDTDIIPEMKDLGKIDIALLPVGGKYTMSAEEAAKAANMIKAEVSVPMHYGAGVIGDEKDAKRFVELCHGQVKILKEVGK